MNFVNGTALDLGNLSKPTSPNVLGSINPNSIRAHSSSRKASRKTPKASSCSTGRTPKSSSKKKFTFEIHEDVDESKGTNNTSTYITSPTNLSHGNNRYRSKSRVSSPTEEFDKVARSSLFVDVDLPPSYSSSSAPSSTTSASTKTSSPPSRTRPSSAKSVFAQPTKPRSPLSRVTKLSDLPTSTTQQFTKSPSQQTSLASAPKMKQMKTPSPPPATTGKTAMSHRGTHHQLPLSLGGRYSSPTDSTFSPCTTAMMTNNTRVMNSRKAMAEKKFKTERKESSKDEDNEEELSVIVPLERANKYKKKATTLPRSSLSSTTSSTNSTTRTSTLPTLGMKKNARNKLFSPTDTLLSPVSSNFYKRDGNGKKLQKMDARKAIFLRQNKK